MFPIPPGASLCIWLAMRPLSSLTLLPLGGQVPPLMATGGPGSPEALRSGQAGRVSGIECYATITSRWQ